MQENCDEFEFSYPENPLPARFQLYRKQKKLTDVTIKVGGLEFEAHRLVLEDSSPVFRVMLSDNWFSGKVLEFSEDSLDCEIIEDLLNFFYTARIKITTENVRSLCFAAHYLQIHDLLKICEKFMVSKLSFKNILNFNNLSTKLKLEDLRKNCDEFFAAENKNILKDEKLLTFCLEEITKIFEKIKIRNEDDEDLKENMFRFMISWVENDSHTREPFLPMLLKSLPLDKLSYKFLSEEASQIPMINNSFHCSRLLNEVFRKSASRPPLSCSTKFQLYCLGGENEEGKYLFSVSKMDSTTKQWKRMPFRLRSNYGYGAVAIRNKIYVCGGKNEIKKFNILDVFDCQTKNWSSLPPMQEERIYFGMATLNEKIYVSGGKNFTKSDCSSVEEYSSDTETWKQIQSMNRARDGHKLIILNDEMYAIGGYGTKTVEKYNSSSNTWHFVASLNHEHYNFGCAVRGNKIYVLSEKGFETYYPISNTWRNLSKLDIGRGSELVSFDDKLWAVGGGESNNEYKASKSMFEYDVFNNSWKKLPDMDVARRLHCAVVVNY